MKLFNTFFLGNLEINLLNIKNKVINKIVSGPFSPRSFSEVVWPSIIDNWVVIDQHLKQLIDTLNDN